MKISFSLYSSYIFLYVLPNFLKKGTVLCVTSTVLNIAELRKYSSASVLVRVDNERLEHDCVHLLQY